MQTSGSTPAAADTLETERLIGKRIRPANERELTLLHTDPRVMATLSADGKPFSPEVIARVVAAHVEHWAEHRFGSWVFFDRAGGAFVGRAGLRHVVLQEQDEVELLYALMPEWWRRGLATEMSRAILAEGFGTLALPSVVSFTLTTNLGSRGVMEKLGFRFERDGERVGLPHVFYRLERSEVSA